MLDFGQSEFLHTGIGHDFLAARDRHNRPIPISVRQSWRCLRGCQSTATLDVDSDPRIKEWASLRFHLKDFQCQEKS